MKDIKSLTLSQLKEEMAALGEKPFRAKQLYEWMHVKLARDYGEMTNIPKSLIAKCRENYTYTSLKEVTVQTSAIDGTKKFLFELADGNLVESVWMQYHHGNSVCISSQVGCRMGCRFCASTLETLDKLAEYCSEYLIHAVDVEGKAAGIETELATMLGTWGKQPMTYAGGVGSFDDLESLKQCGQDRIDVTVGSALDIFGGALPYDEVVKFCS